MVPRSTSQCVDDSVLRVDVKPRLLRVEKGQRVVRKCLRRPSNHVSVTGLSMRMHVDAKQKRSLIKVLHPKSKKK